MASTPIIPTISIALLVLFLLYKYILYPLYLSPLAKVPGAHLTASIAPFWILWKRYQARENATLLNAHERLGPVIRLGPNEVSINCVDDGIRTVYSGGFEKHEWYPNLFSNYDGVPVMFSTAHSTPHSYRKRMLSNVYSKSHIQSSPTFLHACRTVIFERVLPEVLSSSSKDHPTKSSRPINARRLFESATMDLVTAYLLGPRNGSNFLQNPEQAAEWLHLYQSRKVHVFWPQEMPRTTAFFARLGINLSPSWVAQANHKLEAWCLDICDAAESQILVAGNGNHDAAKPEAVPVVYAQLRTHLAKESGKSSAVPVSTAPARIQIASKMLDHASAGHETSAITLTFLFHELSLRPSLQRRLRDELLTLEPRIRCPAANAPLPDLPTPKQLDALPLLHAVITETLRLHPAIPGPQPRITPSTPGGTMLGPYRNIPAGVRVSANPLCLHRNEAVFHNADRWIPERWMPRPGREKELAEQWRWFWAFGSGGRMCVGNNLAMAQMKVVIAALLSNFGVVRADRGLEGADEDSAQDLGLEGHADAEPLLCRPFLQEDAYTAQPVEAELLLRFVPW